MKFTSMGHHTYDIFRKLSVEEGDNLYDDAYERMKQTGDIRIRPLHKKDTDFASVEFTERLKSKSRYFLIEYTTGSKGLSWLLRLSPKSPGFINYLSTLDGGDVDYPCSIKARINPKLFVGIRDYLTAANAYYLGRVETLFNLEAAKISPILGSFNDYEFNRIDYCINFALREMGIECDPLLIMELFRRSNIPKHFHLPLKSLKGELPPFDGKTAVIASRPADEPDRDKFILKSDSININCYYKYTQLREAFIECPNYRDSSDVIRFEVQCLYPKAYYMSRALKNREGFTNLFSELLSDDTSARIINNYFEKIIRRGDYYSMDKAVKLIQSHHFALKKENRLIAVLMDVNTFGGIYKAKIMLVKPDVREDFRRSLRELAAIKINPVTIPEKYEIDHIPNLLDAYYRMVAEERDKKWDSEVNLKILDGFLSKKGKGLLRKQKLG